MDREGEQVNKDVLGRCIFQEVAEGPWYGTRRRMFLTHRLWGAKRMHEAYEYFCKRYERCGIDLTREPVEIFPTAQYVIGRRHY